jgi:DNA-binding response OmpR family regulator
VSATISSPHILIVDDDADVTAMIAQNFGGFGMRGSQAASSAQMREILEQNVVDLVVLDLRLKQEDGMALLREMRANTNIPLVILPVRDDPTDRILALEFGAMITKPVNLRELFARIRTVPRRTLPERQNLDAEVAGAYRFAGWQLDMRTWRSSSSRRTVQLIHTEYELLVAFLRSPQRILSREQLLRMTRHSGEDIFDRSIDVQILRLRRKDRTGCEPAATHQDGARSGLLVLGEC